MGERDGDNVGTSNDEFTAFVFIAFVILETVTVVDARPARSVSFVVLSREGSREGPTPDIGVTS